MKKIRGYVYSRPFMGARVPQHVQNLVIRDYCKKHELHFLLSTVEYSILGSLLILEQLLEELETIDGIVMYSLFQLPENIKQRHRIYDYTLNSKSTMHFALEGLSMENEKQKTRIENIWLVRHTLPHCLSFKEN